MCRRPFQCWALPDHASTTRCPGGISAPRPCPAGTFNPQTNQSDPAACQVCGVELSAFEFSWSYGYHVAPSDCRCCILTSQACAEGSYTDTVGSVSCLPCPAGSSCVNVAASPSACQIGQFSLEGSATCTVSLFIQSSVNPGEKAVVGTNGSPWPNFPAFMLSVAMSRGPGVLNARCAAHHVSCWYLFVGQRNLLFALPCWLRMPFDL